MRFSDAIARPARTLLFLAPLACGLGVACPVVAKPYHGVPTAPAAHARCSDNTGSIQQLAQISNTRDSNLQCLGLTVEGGAITALRIETHRRNASEDAVKVAEFPVAQIESRRGAVLDGTPGHDAVIVRGQVPHAGNVVLVASYLYNGLTGEYHSCRITLDRQSGDAQPGWRLVNQFNQTVSRIVVRTRSVPLLGTIGIADLEGACTPAQS